MQTFANYNQRIPGVKKAFDAFKALADGTTDKPFLLCIGGVGNGKTHLIMATINRLNERGVFRAYQAWYQTAPDFFDYLRSGMNTPPGVPDVEERTRQMSRCPFLCLDDLGMEYGTKWEYARLDQIIDARYRNRLITIAATNKDISELKAVMERVISRFSDTEISQLVLNEGSDYRRKRPVADVRRAVTAKGY